MQWDISWDIWCARSIPLAPPGRAEDTRRHLSYYWTLPLKWQVWSCPVRVCMYGSYSRIRTVIKNLLQIGANLSQSREFRDLFEDILTKVLQNYVVLVSFWSILNNNKNDLIFWRLWYPQVVEPLEEANLSIEELNRFMVCSIAAADMWESCFRTVPWSYS